ncbi:uncharacterized protein LOC109795840 [Cajanus cajan]|uniref:Uncharacterized protein n=1 Tax=Cajanus cajan TaxID=3821 RepID=A0A151UAA2_CAJCA|nr:uncharacterized protein LOC109795840 [Cajanus cajan]KYP76199.1 hypothetical protein KK1_020430 [Cajanus cajan]
MNGGTIDFIEDNGNGSDSDANSDDAPEYYQPISAVDDDGSSDGEHGGEFGQLPNGFAVHGVAENGISSLDLSDGVEKSSSDEEEEELDERSEEEIERALREEENRRNAPLTAENATRVMEAMRGVSFVGVVPDWAARDPHDQWINQLHRLRGSSNT